MCEYLCLCESVSYTVNTQLAPATEEPERKEVVRSEVQLPFGTQYLKTLWQHRPSCPSLLLAHSTLVSGVSNQLLSTYVTNFAQVLHEGLSFLRVHQQLL